MQALIAYAAGFFDGEGCVSLEEHKGEYRLRCITSQKFVDAPLHLMRDLFGGNVHIFATGITKHLVNGRAAVRMLEQMMPYLLVKKDQAEIAVRVFEMDRAERQQALTQIRALKREYKVV